MGDFQLARFFLSPTACARIYCAGETLCTNFFFRLFQIFFFQKRLTDLSSKIKTTIQPVFISRKLNEDVKVREVKPATVNQQCVVYKFQCNLCDAGYVGYTRGHLHERVDGHKQKSSSICKHYLSEHNSNIPSHLSEQFHVLTKCSNKFDCLIKEMLFIRKLKPSLNVQTDSIRAKVFT